MYRWIITNSGYCSTLEGICGPRRYNATIKDNHARFSLWDDDGNCLASGMIYGEYDGFEPLDDYGTPSLGCVAIKINGEWL